MALNAAKGIISFLLTFGVVSNMEVTAQELEFVGSCEVPWYTRSVYVDGDYAYMAQENFGLRIVSIADPTNPVIVGSYEISPQYAWDVIARNDYAYLVGSGGLNIVDVSDPTNPVYSGSHSTLGTALSIFLRGGYAYIGEENHFEILDINDPAAPHQVGFYGYPPYPAWLDGISVAGDYAYTVSWIWWECLYGWCYLDIFDISDPGEPELVSSFYAYGGSFDVSVAGDYAYLVCWSLPLLIVNIADPLDPYVVGEWTDTGYAGSVFLSAPYAYLTGGVSSVRRIYVINIADPANPTTVTSYNMGPATIIDIFVIGEYIYVAATESLFILKFVNVSCEGTYIPGDCNSNGVPLELADVIAMVGMYRGNTLPAYTCDCSPHGHIFAPQADPNGNCIAYELTDVVTEIGAYRGLASVSGCPDCPGSNRLAPGG